MSMFSIHLTKSNIELEGQISAVGHINIGNFDESFHSSLSYWSREQYLRQWQEGLNRLVSGESNSALVTSMHNPKDANFIFWWVFYNINEKIYIQNHVLFMDELDPEFDESNLYKSIPERETRTEDGEMISEWAINLSDIQGLNILCK